MIACRPSRQRSRISCAPAFTACSGTTTSAACPVWGGTRPRKTFKTCPIGSFHLDLAEVWTEDGKLSMFVVIDWAGRFACAELHERATRRIAADVLRRLIERVPYTIYTVLTDTGTHFTEPRGGSRSVPEIRAMIDRKEIFRARSFELACAQNDIDHRLTEPNRPWTNGQVEPVNRTIKEATVRRDDHERHGSATRASRSLPRCL